MKHNQIRIPWNKGKTFEKKTACLSSLAACMDHVSLYKASAISKNTGRHSCAVGNLWI